MAKATRDIRESQVTFNRPTDPPGHADDMLAAISAIHVIGSPIFDCDGNKLGIVFRAVIRDKCVYLHSH